MKMENHKGRADGTGQGNIKEENREKHVEGQAPNAPGGESKGGKHIEIQGGGKK